MTRIPVRFRESLNISEPVKMFIKKCLEVDESKRMSLDDLKQWIAGDFNGQNAMMKSLNPLQSRN